MIPIALPPANINVWQSPFELEAILAVFRWRSPRRILELGSADGGTLWCWVNNCEKNSYILSVDWFHPHYPDNRCHYGEWALATESYIEAIHGDTRDESVLQKVKDRGPFDWLMIDAGHAIKEVTSDWEHYGPLVRQGGVVVFHDITPKVRPNEVEVTVLWNRLKQTRSHMEIFNDLNDNKFGFGVLFV